MRELRGNLHVHSDLSDGTLPIPDIARTAQQCELDFVGINDHHVKCSESQYLSGVLMLMGTEFNSRHSHYLAYNTSAVFEEKQVDGAEVIGAVKKSGGMGIIAHPFEKGAPAYNAGKHYPWQDWNVAGYNGIELWNLSSQWKDAIKSYPQALRMWVFNRHKPFCAGACSQALAKWDEVCQQGHVTGVAGSDLHAPYIGPRWLGLKVLGYSMLFSAANNYVLVERRTGRAEEDSALLLDALTRGRCWFALDWLAEARGFAFRAEAGGNLAAMGDTLTSRTARVWLQVRIPRRGEITVLRNGRPVHVQHARDKFEYPAQQAGVYRVEVSLERRGRKIPWIYTNPVYVK